MSDTQAGERWTDAELAEIKAGIYRASCAIGGCSKDTPCDLCKAENVLLDAHRETMAMIAAGKNSGTDVERAQTRDFLNMRERVYSPLVRTAAAGTRQMLDELLDRMKAEGIDPSVEDALNGTLGILRTVRDSGRAAR